MLHVERAFEDEGMALSRRSLIPVHVHKNCQFIERLCGREPATRAIADPGWDHGVKKDSTRRVVRLLRLAAANTDTGQTTKLAAIGEGPFSLGIEGLPISVFSRLLPSALTHVGPPSIRAARFDVL